MRLVLDIQGFTDEKKKFIPKELATYDGNKLSHYIFKQPYPLNFLSPTYYKQAVWLMENYHCIKWNSGFTPLHYFSTIVKELTRNVQIVYVKGQEKADYIKKYSASIVIELDEQPALEPLSPKCCYHSKSPAKCALSNVFYLYNNLFMNE